MRQGNDGNGQKHFLVLWLQRALGKRRRNQQRETDTKFSQPSPWYVPPFSSQGQCFNDLGRVLIMTNTQHIVQTFYIYLELMISLENNTKSTNYSDTRVYKICNIG